MELGDVFVILDDRKARLLALQLSLKVHRRYCKIAFLKL